MAEESEKSKRLHDSVVDFIEVLPLVIAYARKYHNTRLGFDDAVGTGNLALVEAAQKFNPALGVPFGGYAERRVKGAMTDAYRKIHGTRTYPDQEVLISEEEWYLRFSSIDTPFYYADTINALSALCEEDQTVALFLMAGYRKHEVADIMGVSPSRISQRLQRVKEVLLAN